MTRSRLVLAASLVLLFALLAVAALFSLPGAGEGEVLVLEERAHEGPVRLVLAPWSPRRVLALRSPLSLSSSLETGEGASWPLEVRGELVIEADELDESSRRLLIEDPNALALEASVVDEVLEAALSRDGLSELLARPGALAGPMQAALARGLPAGVSLRGIEVGVEMPPAQARAAAMGSVRARSTEPLGRVLYVGLDGLDWLQLDRLMKEGQLPTFARLVRGGVRADLRSYEPMMSPLLWTTAMTGHGPDQHGICDFTLSDADDKQVPITSTFREMPALWEMFSAAGQRSAFVNFWATDPPEEVVGVLVPDTVPQLVADPERPSPFPAGLAWPSELLESERALFETTNELPLDALRSYLPDATQEELDEAKRWFVDDLMRRAWRNDDEHERKLPPLAFLVQLATNSRNIEALTARLLEDDSLEFVGVYFGDIDIAGHNFQHLMPPPHVLAPADERRRFAGVIDAVYRAQDAMLARLIEAAGPDAIVVVHSDHGFVTGNQRPLEILPFTKGQPVEWHRHLGAFVAAGPHVRRAVQVPEVTLYEIVPTMLALRGLPAGLDMRGRVREDLLEPASRALLPKERLPSWTPLVPPRRYAEMDDADLELVRERMLEQLRGLGYIGGDPDEPAGAPAAARSDSSDPGELFPRVTYHRNLATWFMNENRFAEAERELLRANEVEPLLKTFWLLSEARAAQANIPGAIAALEEGIASHGDENTASVVLWLVELHLGKRDVRGARAALERHRGLATNDPAVIEVAEGRISEAEGNAPRARAAYKRALASNPRQVRAAERLLQLDPGPEELGAVERAAEAALAIDPKIETYWSYLGIFRGQRGDARGAVEAFRNAVELAPGNETYRTNHATALLRAGRKREARVAYEALAAAGTRQGAVWVNLGSLRAESGDWKGAVAAWEQARALGLDSPALRESLEDARRRL